MKTRCFLLAAILVLISPMAPAQSDTAHHRAVYEQINAAAARMKKVQAVHKDDPLEFALTGWLQNGEVKKIVATNNIDGGMEEYYLENEQPLFVYNTYRTGAGRGQKIEERMYFQDGHVFKWLTTEKPTPIFHGEDYQATTERLVNNTRNFVAALRRGKVVSIAKPAAADTRVIEGTFLGIEQGDYAHWKMRYKTGEEVSLFILRADTSVNKAMKNPKAYLGRACRVTLKESAENIPEAGGKMEVEQILSVEWLGAK